MEKKTYYVEMPVTMVLKVVGVEATSEQEAIEKVKASNIYIDVKDTDDQFDDIETEWDMHDIIVEGNVFYGMSNEVGVREEEDC